MSVVSVVTSRGHAVPLRVGDSGVFPGVSEQWVFRRGIGVTIDGVTLTGPDGVRVIGGDLNGPWTIRIPTWARAIRMAGAGGGGGGGGGASATFQGGGGASGICVRAGAIDCIPGQTFVITVGAGGAGGAVGVNGAVGELTSIVPSAGQDMVPPLILAGGRGGFGATSAHGIGGVPNTLISGDTANGSTAGAGYFLYGFNGQTHTIAANNLTLPARVDYGVGGSIPPYQAKLARYLNEVAWVSSGAAGSTTPSIMRIFGDFEMVDGPGGFSLFGPLGKGGNGGLINTSGTSGGNGVAIIVFMEKPT